MKEFSNMSAHSYQKNDEAIYLPNIGQTTHYISIKPIIIIMCHCRITMNMVHYRCHFTEVFT